MSSYFLNGLTEGVVSRLFVRYRLKKNRSITERAEWRFG